MPGSTPFGTKSKQKDDVLRTLICNEAQMNSCSEKNTVPATASRLGTYGILEV
jgi:hypothetical protein